MDTTLRYESNNGTVVEFAPSSKYHYTGATLHDYEHQYTVINNRITGFYDEVTEFELSVVVAGESSDDRNIMIEAFEYDVKKLVPGKLWCGDYYLECYITASSKDSWWWEDGHMAATLTIAAEHPKWVHEEFKVFGKGKDVDDTGIDYSHDYSFDYSNNLTVSWANNTGIVPAPFRMRVYGPTDKAVSIIIGANSYGIDVILAAGDVLTIDSRNKTITLKDKSGAETNLFNKRVGQQVQGSGSYIFEGIPSGKNVVSWAANYIFDLTIYDERAEPRW